MLNLPFQGRPAFYLFDHLKTVCVAIYSDQFWPVTTILTSFLDKFCANRVTASSNNGSTAPVNG